MNTENNGIHANDIETVGNLDKPEWIESRRRIYSSEGVSPTLHGIGCGGNTEAKVLVCVGGSQLIQKGTLDFGKWAKMTDIYRRYYSTQGIAPTIHTCPGGNTEPKIIEDNEEERNEYNCFNFREIRK